MTDDRDVDRRRPPAARSPARGDGGGRRSGASPPSPKTLPPVWFYDERGSELFDEITRLPEYYPTRAERSILARARRRDRASSPGADVLVELGSGTSDKTRLLLDAMADAGTLQRFVPFDVSEETLRHAAADDHGGVRDPRARDRRRLPPSPRRRSREDGRRLVAFLGSTIGNLDPAQRRRFFFDLDTTLDYDDWLLLGTDLVKDPARLVAAYDDAAGVTADVQPERARRAQPRARRALRPRRVRTRRACGTTHDAVDRDAAAVHDRPDRRDRRSRAEGSVRRRRRDAHRDRGEVHRGTGARGALGLRVRRRGDAGPTRTATSCSRSRTRTADHYSPPRHEA